MQTAVFPESSSTSLCLLCLLDSSLLSMRSYTHGSHSQRLFMLSIILRYTHRESIMFLGVGKGMPLYASAL